mgnify:CR=1 FL=1
MLTLAERLFGRSPFPRGGFTNDVAEDVRFDGGFKDGTLLVGSFGVNDDTDEDVLRAEFVLNALDRLEMLLMLLLFLAEEDELFSLKTCSRARLCAASRNRCISAATLSA